MKWSTALRLGRVSNLPTVWSNVLAGAVLVQPEFDRLTMLMTAIAISLLYISGMFLNDVFDLEWDRRHQPRRPLVAGEASVKETLSFSIAFIAIALVLLALAAARPLPVLLSSAVLISLIILYDWKHKQWAFSPWLMGACRSLVYLTAAASVGGDWNSQVLVAGLCLLAYIAAITYVARLEHLNALHSLWPVALLFAPLGFVIYLGFHDIWSWLLVLVVLYWLIRSIRLLMPGKHRQVPRAVGGLLAGIALIDTAILMALGQQEAALLTAGCFTLCQLAQRKIAAT
jgi:4-hydroxybenzoate polyprenyltransferase